MPRAESLKLLALMAAFWSVSAVFCQGQSSRPGWGSTPYHDGSGTGATFRVWAPNATGVSVPGQFNSWSTTATPLAKEYTNATWTGIWSVDVPGVLPGQQYKYYLNYAGGSVWKHDPRSRLVTDSGTAPGANDVVYDPNAYLWQNDSLSPPSTDDLIIYELHPGTFCVSGGPTKFLSAVNRLDYLKSLGINAVEVMPIAEFPGANSWGYNASQQFAVENIGYGGPDGFKSFVKACHARGLAVLLDVVHNHYGPMDLDMWNFDGWSGNGSLQGGIYFNQSNTNLQHTPYGDTRPNFDSPQVDDFVRDNFTMWLNEYHVDGFRWDTPGLMMNADNYGYIASAGSLISSINAMMHSAYPGKINISEDVYDSYGFDSAWDTSYPYYLTPVLTNTVDANRDMSIVANAIQYNVRYGGSANTRRVMFLETHDVVASPHGGARLVKAIDPASPDSYRARKLSTLGAAVTITAPGVPMIFQGQEMLESQAFDSTVVVDWSKTNTYSATVRLYRDLIGARRNSNGYTPGLKGDQFAMLKVDDGAKLVAFHRWQSGASTQGAVVVANFAGVARTNYPLTFPRAGNWYAHFNSDSTSYGADYSNIGSTVVTASNGNYQANITIGPYSMLIFSPIPEAVPTLKVAFTNQAINISWPINYGQWLLEQNSTVTVPGAWTTVAPAQFQTNGLTITFAVTPSSGSSFYRLRKP